MTEEEERARAAARRYIATGKIGFEGAVRYGVIDYPNGEHYEGGIRSGLKHGQGVLT